MKRISLVLLLTLTSWVWARGLDYRLFQYPVESAKESAASAYPTFAAYVLDNKERRMPGVDAKYLDIIKKKYRIKIMNEYRLYDSSEMELDERILLERYCTRYNRQLIVSLGL